MGDTMALLREADPLADALAPFLSAIRADSHSPTPWLILADWLEEQGDVRCRLLRAYLGARSRELPIIPLDVKLRHLKTKRELRLLNCLISRTCRPMPLYPDSVTYWEQADQDAQECVLAAELYALGLDTRERMDKACAWAKREHHGRQTLRPRLDTTIRAMVLELPRFLCVYAATPEPYWLWVRVKNLFASGVVASQVASAEVRWREWLLSMEINDG